MRLVICLLTLFPAVGLAQQSNDITYDRELIVSRLNFDLARLKTVSSDPSLLIRCRIASDRSAPRPDACAPADRVRDDLALIHPRRTRQYPPEILSMNLIRVLAGRELEPDALSLLASSLVDAVTIADRAIEVRRSVSGSRPFHNSVMQVYTGLLALGIERNRAENFLSNFVRSAETLSKPPDFEPIPNARPF
jgi:hypothetical protein